MAEVKRSSTMKADIEKVSEKETKPKTTVRKTATKTAAKKVAENTAEKATKTPRKKASVKPVPTVNLQFDGKSYSVEDLTKIAEDVWKYDLHKEDEAYKSLELYVKPKEDVVYYVFNEDVAGSFFI